MILRRHLLLTSILVLLLPLKIAMRPGEGPYGLDASYYYQIARHVAEGDGLLTSVSLYHEGLDPLPAPARIYPLWPLLLGMAGRMIGMQAAANVLPAGLYFADLILLYLLGNAIAVRMRGTAVLAAGAISLEAGHVAVLLFATNRLFLTSTSHPYTEGLAFGMAFASLLLTDSAAERSSDARFAGAGLLAGLAFLARSQMVIVAATVLPLLLCAAYRSRALVRGSAVYGAGLIAGIAPWFLYRSMKPVPRTDIGSFTIWVDSASAAAYFADRLPGLAVAFDPGSTLSYFGSFGAATALVPVALLAAIIDFVQRRFAGVRICTPSTLLVASAIGITLASHAILTHRHAQFFLPWLFGWRHGLPFIFGLTVAVIYLATHRSAPIRFGVTAVIALTVITGALHGIRMARQPRIEPTKAQRLFTEWMRKLPEPPTILTTNPQQLGMLTRGRFHWITCTEAPAQTHQMLVRLPIDYVVITEAEAPCPFVQLPNELVPRYLFGDPGERMIVLARRR